MLYASETIVRSTNLKKKFLDSDAPRLQLANRTEILGARRDGRRYFLSWAHTGRRRRRGPSALRRDRNEASNSVEQEPNGARRQRNEATSCDPDRS